MKYLLEDGDMLAFSYPAKKKTDTTSVRKLPNSNLSVPPKDKRLNMHIQPGRWYIGSEIATFWQFSTHRRQRTEFALSTRQM